MGLLANEGFLDAVYVTDSDGSPASGLSPVMTAIRLDTGATSTPTVAEIGSLAVYKVTNWTPSANTEYFSIWTVTGDYTIHYAAKLFKVGGGQEASILTDLGDFSGQSNLQSLLAALGIPDVSGKPLYTCVITDRLDHGTYGLSAMDAELEDIRQKATGPSWNQDTDSLEAQRDALDVVDGYHDVPSADSTNDLRMRDVVGKKNDTAQTTIGTTHSLMRYIKGIITLIGGLSGNALIPYTGTTTSNGAADGTTLVDSAMTEGDDYWNGTQILITSGSYDGQVREVIDFDSATDTVTVYPAFGGQIVSSVTFSVLGIRSGESMVTSLASLLASSTGQTTSAGNAGGTTLVDTGKTQGDDYWNGMSLMLLSGSYEGQTREITDFDSGTDTFTVGTAFGGQVASGIDYVILPTLSNTATTERITCHMDFWSDNDDVITLTTTSTDDHNLPNLTVASIPTGVTVTRVVAMLKIALVKDTSASDNAINGATALKVDADGGYGSLVTAIDITDNSWGVDVSEATERGGDVLMGDNDVKAEITGNGTFYGQLTDIACDGNNLLLKDVAWGVRVYFTP